MRGSILKRKGKRGTSYTAIYRGVDRKQHWETLQRKAEAEAYLNNELQRAVTEGYSSSNATFREFVEQHYLPDIERRRVREDLRAVR